MTNEKSGITYSLRTRMTVMMTVLLLLALAALQYQNQQARVEVQHALEKQKYDISGNVDVQLREIIIAANVGVLSLTDDRYLYVTFEHQTPFDRNVIRHLVVATETGVIDDSIEPDLVTMKLELPESLTDPSGDPNAPYVPYVVPGDPIGARTGLEEEESVTYWFKTKTTSGLRFIGVVASSKGVSTAMAESQANLSSVIGGTAADRVNTTLAVFGLALVLTILLVWRFTRPIRQLSYAAERVARGDLDFKTDIHRRDEIGQLSETFDEMIAQLKAKSELEERLNNAERAAVIGRLTGAIAHEIRNPLNYINLSIDHVRERFAPVQEKDRQRFDHLLGSIKEEIARLNRLVLDVLNFGRPANLNFRRIDLREVLESVLGLVRQQAEEQNVSIAATLPDTPVTIQADAEKLKSCFSNVVINALQAMPSGGTLTVDVNASEGTYHVRIADTGTGIPEDALDRVFEPYYSTKDTGTGLGLAVTKKLVDEHGGRIHIASTLGVGTTFDVELPIARESDGSQGENESVKEQLVSAASPSLSEVPKQ